MGQLLFKSRDQNSRQLFEAAKTIEEKLPNYNNTEMAYNHSIRVDELQFRRLLAAMLRDAKTVYFYARELSLFLKTLPKEVFEIYKKYYYLALSSQMNYAPNIEVLSPILSELENIPKEDSKYIDSQGSFVIMLTQVDVNLLSGNYEACQRFFQDTKYILDSIKNVFPISTIRIWYYKMAMYYYALKDYKGALEVIDKYLDVKDIDSVIKDASLLLRIIIYYEEQEYILLSSFLNSIKRYLKKNEALFNFEKQFISLMTKLIKLPTAQHRALLISFREKIVAELKMADNHEKECLVLFNYIGWLDSQINKKAFKQLYFRHVDLIDF